MYAGAENYSIKQFCVYNGAMRKKEIHTVEEALERKVLPFVRGPGRYIGGEVNQIKKDLDRCDVRIALCFPDLYEIAMSHTGLAVLYEAVNRKENMAAERCFAPRTDAGDLMKREGVPLFTLESKAAVRDFDIAGFTLTNELCYTNMLYMLDLAGIALRSKDRCEDDPLILGGSQMANTAEPIAEFVDMFILGRAEFALCDVSERFLGLREKQAARDDILYALAKEFDFVYVPKFYEFRYDGSRIVSFAPMREGLPASIKDTVIDDFDSAPVPDAPLVPFVQAVHERVSVEVMHGCPGRCRFCQASFCRRPVRYRSVEKIVETARKQYESTGFDTVSLLSLSTADYPHLEELVERLNEYFLPRRVGISLPSLKIKEQLRLLPKLVSSVRKPGLTIAVEAASERLRRMINKDITDNDLFAAAESAYRNGFRSVKLYFMMGFEGETEEDIKKIVRLSAKLSMMKKDIDGRPASITASVSPLVPKPHTPFGWIGQKSADYFRGAARLILDTKREMRIKPVSFKFHDIRRSVLEAVFARGDRRLGDVIVSAYQKGAVFDLWDEHFEHDIWQGAFKEHGVDTDALAQRNFDEHEILPWEHLGGPNREYLLEHLRMAREELK